MANTESSSKETYGQLVWKIYLAKFYFWAAVACIGGVSVIAGILVAALTRSPLGFLATIAVPLFILLMFHERLRRLLSDIRRRERRRVQLDDERYLRNRSST